MLSFLTLSILFISSITHGHDGEHGAHAADAATTNASIESIWDFESSPETFEDNAAPQQLNSYGSLIFAFCLGAGCLFLIVMTACRVCDRCARRQQRKWEKKQADHIAKERRLSTIRIQAQKNSIHSGSLSTAMEYNTPITNKGLL